MIIQVKSIIQEVFLGAHPYVFSFLACLACVLISLVHCGAKKPKREQTPTSKTPSSTTSNASNLTPQQTPTSQSPAAEVTKSQTNDANGAPDSKETTPEKTGKKGEKMEDSFDKLQPKKEEAKRGKEIKGTTTQNKGDYKTWNKYMEASDFDKTFEPNEEKKNSEKEKEKTEKEKEDGDKVESKEKIPDKSMSKE